MSDIKAVIFDFDGTLVNSMWVWDRLLPDFLSKYNLVATNDMYKRVALMTLVESSEYICNEFKSLNKTPEEVRVQWRDMIYDSYTEKIKLKSGAYELLHRLKENNIKTAIATTCAPELLEVCLKSNGIDDMFNIIVYADETGEGKESPKIYSECLRRLNCDASEAILFEDILTALNSAKKIGLKTIIVEDNASLSDKEELMRKADKYILDFTELV